jgi:hypothetical protein
MVEGPDELPKYFFVATFLWSLSCDIQNLWAFLRFYCLATFFFFTYVLSLNSYIIEVYKKYFVHTHMKHTSLLVVFVL